MSLSLPPHHQKSLDSTQCSGCLQTDDRDDMPVTYDGRDVCWLCVSVGFLFCTKCGLLFDKGIMFEPEGSDIECICPDCMKIITGMTLPKHQLALPARREYRKKTRNEIIADLTLYSQSANLKSNLIASGTWPNFCLGGMPTSA